MSTQLFAAIEAGDADAVEALVAADPRLAAARNPAGVSALLAACYRRRPDLVALLRATDRQLDVFEAAALGDVDRLEALLATDPTLADAWAPDGFFPLALAAFFGHTLAVKRLLDAGADPAATARNPMAIQAIHAAAAAGSRMAVRHLLEAGADPDSRQHGGWTALMAAAAAGDLTMIDDLLAAGADPCLRNDDGDDAVTLAARAGHDEAAARLA